MPAHRSSQELGLPEHCSVADLVGFLLAAGSGCSKNSKAFRLAANEKIVAIKRAPNKYRVKNRK